MRDIKDYTEKYIDEPFEKDMVKIRKKAILEICARNIHNNILEIGCGMEPFFLDCVDYKKMVIVEPGEIFVKRAKELAKKQEKDIQIIFGYLEEQVKNIKKLGIEFDLIILSSLLHELDEPQKMLKAIKELCSSSTIVHINVPNADSLHRLIAKEMGMIQDVHEQSEQMKKMQRRRTYDMELLKEEVERTGMKIIDSGSYFLKPFTHSQMQRCLDEKIIDENVVEGLIKVIKHMPKYGAEIYVNVKK